MDIRFELTGPDSRRELRSLHAWLHDDRALRDGMRIEPVRERSGGAMGGDLEAVLALVSTVAALAQLPFSYAAWREGRRPRSQVVIHVHGAAPDELTAVRRAFPDDPVQAAPDAGAEPAAQPQPEGDRGQ
ncbi:hypothetical protein AB0C96_29645 [Streptomyces sp. NPDC048506]|uniref:effector-associated constant component EACC1 n=1 Tax=Streptomyces sp. NPDC048506 TaxID=3155028 RepID=UPI00343F6378